MQLILIMSNKDTIFICVLLLNCAFLNSRKSGVNICSIGWVCIEFPIHLIWHIYNSIWFFFLFIDHKAIWTAIFLSKICFGKWYNIFNDKIYCLWIKVTLTFKCLKSCSETRIGVIDKFYVRTIKFSYMFLPDSS